MTSKRKCIYTDEEATALDKVVPKNGGDEVHNWSNSVPCSQEYKDKKGNSHPTELEVRTNRAFKMLELAKLDVVYWERELKKLQSQNKPKKSKNQEKIKKKEIKLAEKEQEIKEIPIEKVLEERKKIKKYSGR